MAHYGHGAEGWGMCAHEDVMHEGECVTAPNSK